MDKITYTLCAATSVACAWLLLRGYFRTGFRLLLWSGLCFVGLALNNGLLVLDRIVYTDVDLSSWRLVLALVAVLLLVTGLVLEGED